MTDDPAASPLAAGDPEAEPVASRSIAATRKPVRSSAPWRSAAATSASVKATGSVTASPGTSSAPSSRASPRPRSLGVLGQRRDRVALAPRAARISAPQRTTGTPSASSTGSRSSRRAQDQLGLELARGRVEAGVEDPGVGPARRQARLGLGLEQRDRDAAAGELERGRAADDARADDRDLGVHRLAVAQHGRTLDIVRRRHRVGPSTIGRSIKPLWRSASATRGGDDDGDAGRPSPPPSRPRTDAASDEQQLAELGYKQELKRALERRSPTSRSRSRSSRSSRGPSRPSPFAWQNGGPIAVSIGWPMLCALVLMVALSMAELTSAYPTAGGPYWWAHELGGKGWSWITGWFNIVGLVGIVASVGYGAALFLNALLGLYGLDIFGVNFGDDRPHPRRDVRALPPDPRPLHGCSTSSRDRVLALLNNISVGWHVLGVAVIIALLVFVPDDHQSAELRLRRADQQLRASSTARPATSASGSSCCRSASC